MSKIGNGALNIDIEDAWKEKKAYNDKRYRTVQSGI